MASTGSDNNPESIADRSRLTEEEKRNNHINSEHRRREGIRYEFDRLASLVPGMEGLGRSEYAVLQATVRFLRNLLEERERLLVEARSHGLDVSGFDDLK
ncbi:hypothetical protein BDY21DRAFT_284570 [Lineolata rhizophorae]|uniref:BHLH domain-containing protein n=1 Tax=Lineolata rhizophorae TaxID=578093 RepID=A0A6A6P3D4_9PEZI|nr:hypothetical protein BDY21DRAFT_284570 [Lineolata rhizophorae]